MPIFRRKPKVSHEAFAEMFRKHGVQGTAQLLQVHERRVFERRTRAEAALGIKLESPIGPGGTKPGERDADLAGVEAPRMEIDFTDGVVLVGGDAHYWPGPSTTAHRGFCYFAKELKPKIVIMNGDALDASSISRHPPIGWEGLPSLADELAAVQERLGEITTASRRARRIWPLGNHDARFNTRLAMQTPEFRHVPGTRLVDHFPDWEPCWAAFIGGQGGAVVKHRFKGGIHAPHNNAMWAGRTMITGHLHSQKVTPFTDYNGTRWGVDAGCLAAPRGPQFTYIEENPRNHVSGFCVLTWAKGVLLPPELATVISEERGIIWFRGKEIAV